MSSSPPPPPPRPVLDKPRHTRYWLRCLKSCLPTEYTATDTTRMTLGCFSVAALDLLGELPFLTSPEDRASWISWIYANQLAGGGFRGSPATDIGAPSRWDPPNLSASFFAIATLISLGDDLAGVDRIGLLNILRQLQRADGSFGDTLLAPDEPAGATDMRFVYMACALRWMLRGQEGRGCAGAVRDFDVDASVRYVTSAQGYDGGVSEKAFGESHAGMTYCAVAALTLLGRGEGLRKDDVVRWCVFRQVAHEPKDEMEEDEWDEVVDEVEREEGERVELEADGKPRWAGFQGRCNKRADTCYSFWVGASLDVSFSADDWRGKLN